MQCSQHHIVCRRAITSHEFRIVLTSLGITSKIELVVGASRRGLLLPPSVVFLHEVVLPEEWILWWSVSVFDLHHQQ